MAMSLNVVVVSGNLTRDAEVRSLANDNSVTKLRLAVNDRYKDRDSGEWKDRPYFFDVTVWGKQGENVARYCGKGSPVCVHGRLTWREWQADDGTNRQAIEIVAEKVLFMGTKGDGDRGDRDGGRGQSEYSSGGVPAADDDDIPF